MINLSELKQATNEVLDGLAPADFAGEAINWGDLRCVSAERFTDETDFTGYRVYIEEAAPYCAEFQEAVWNALMKRFSVDVEVVTEW